MKKLACFIKRVFDVVLSFLLLVLLLLFIIAIWLLVRIKLGAPAIFSQERPGVNGRIFKIYKFRTMTDAKDSSGALLPDDERLTKFGSRLRASSLDELPELFNILRGDMSFVGPRPLLVKYLSRYTERQARRHEVKPGLTGWAQVNGRNAISWEEKFEFDVWYVDNRSLWLDFKIICMTIVMVFKRTGINSDACATMEEFKGTEQ
jgi:sugar transferase EpsL